MTPFPREEFKAWIAKLAQLDAYENAAVVYADEPEAFVVGAGRLRITFTSDVAAAIEETYEAPVDPQTTVGTAVAITRELDYITLTLVFELQDPATTTFPSQPLRRIRTKGYQDVHLDELRAMGLCLVDVGSVIPIKGRTIENRVLPAAALDIKLGFYNVDVPTPDEVTSDFIDETRVEGTFIA